MGPGQERPERQVPPAEGPEGVVQAGDDLQERLEPGALDRRVDAVGRVRGFEPGVGQADLVEDRLHLGLGLDVAPLLLLGQHVERRLGDVEVPLGHEPGHLAVEERHQERPDVRAVDVGVAHHDDLAVPPLGGVFLVADPVADGRDDVADLLVAQDPVEPGSLDVEDLAPERQDRLVEPVAAPFGGAAGRVALDEEQLARILVVGGAVHQLAGQAAAGEDALAVPDQVAGLAGRLAGLGRELGLGDHLLGRLRVLLEELGRACR